MLLISIISFISSNVSAELIAPFSFCPIGPVAVDDDFAKWLR
tara:strand:+ start:1099 stop:1224 length:126 start_codon:yes stop_codon:yes gene_type:complete